MGSVQPISVPDLNGIELNAGDIITDEYVGYVGYVRNLCTDLGTSKDTSEGFKSFLDFQEKIESAKIATFEPESIEKLNRFDGLDLTGENDAVEMIRRTEFMMYCGARLLMCNGGGFGYTPFDLPGTKGDFMKPVGYGITPFDETGKYSTAPAEPSYA